MLILESLYMFGTKNEQGKLKWEKTLNHNMKEEAIADTLIDILVEFSKNLIKQQLKPKKWQRNNNK